VAGVKSTSTVSGILLADKPAGMTSHDVVSRTRRLAGTRKVGHAGTLDPMATGLLILGVNSSTRLLTYIVGLDKEYHATVRFGTATSTDDAEGEPTGRPATAAEIAAVTDEAIARVFAGQTGTIEQVPSSVSAIKVDGKRAYARVREGEEVVLKARTVTIPEIEIRVAPRPADDGTSVDVDVRVVCSSGTYIRAIARDAGVSLGVGGHLTALRRTRIGPFRIDDAKGLDELAALVDDGHPVPLQSAADGAAHLFPVWRVSAAEAVSLGHGQRVDVPDPVPWAGAAASTRAPAPVAALTPEGRLLGLLEITGAPPRAWAKSIVNFPPDEYRDGSPA
jgi:tRNA pseudouridine55 synthase